MRKIAALALLALPICAAAPAAAGQRPKMIPGSFEVLVVGEP
ncbi:MAG: hypothetical protein QOJ94_1552 [Sphingomonadales bacterium]|jgi:hypothetical protein|nr:hypothetical protein [Sphingomonadales bacterium]